MTITAKFALSAAALALLSGCAAQHPPLVNMAPAGVRLADNGKAVPITPGDELQGILAEAHSLQVIYAHNYLKTAKWSDLSALPLIALGSIAALVLFNDKTNAARDAGKLAIGAGAYAGVRSAVSNPKIADYYIGGHSALTCVAAQATLFTGTKADEAASELKTRLTNLGGTRLTLRNVLKAPYPAVPTKDEEKLIEAARSLADSAIAAAAPVELVSASEYAAFNSSAGPFRNAVGSISTRVASLAKERPDVEFGSFRDGLLKAAKPAAVAGPQSALVTVSDWIAEVSRWTVALTQRTEELQLGTRPYIAGLEKVSKCPDLVS